MKRHFTKGDIHLAKEQIKRRPISLAIGDKISLHTHQNG